MRVLITGGAGFMGRWVAKRFLDQNNEVIVLDNLSNGSLANIAEFKGNPKFQFIKGDILETELLGDIFPKLDVCIHMAAQVEVQSSLDDPNKSFKTNVVGTYNVLRSAKKHKVKVVVVGTCMVYDMADIEAPIHENHATKPASPYAATKLAADHLALSFYYSYKLPVVIVRPFNTYGPHQKTNLEGGVVGIFVEKALKGGTLNIFGTGEQTRDLLYVEDCADFIYKATVTKGAIGQIINAGTGRDVAINELAQLIVGDKKRIKHLPHHHPQSEIMKLVCDYSKAKQVLNWQPTVPLELGIQKTRDWINHEA